MDYTAFCLCRFPPPTQFSQCSREQLNNGLNRGRGLCLDNNPVMVGGICIGFLFVYTW